MYLSHMVLKLSTVEEFTISSVRSFHLFTALTQNEFILNDFKALCFFQFLVMTTCGQVLSIQKVHPFVYIINMVYNFENLNHVHSISHVV